MTSAKISVGTVSYLNTKPLVYGFKKAMMKDSVDLIIDYPPKTAMLFENEIDAELVPLATEVVNESPYETFNLVPYDTDCISSELDSAKKEECNYFSYN